MDIYEEHENVIKRCKNLENQIIKQEALLRKAVETMNEMLEDFEKASDMLSETSYCDKCNVDKVNCPYRDDDGNSCYNGYGKETQVSELIREIIDEVL